MNIIAKIIIALLAGGAAWAAAGFAPQIPTLLLFLGATVATALLTSIGGAAPVSTSGDITAPAKSGGPKTTPPASGPREEGTVKWFNVSKGFGFITKENGEEIFVHFRSIQGEGRRSLRDGQRVSFIEAQSEKGPQAEDVEPL